MAVIYEDELKKEITSDNFATGYILFGEDSYLKKLYEDKIAEKTAGLDSFFDLQRFSGNCDLQEVYNAVISYPMSSEKKCVIISDFDYEHVSKNDFDKFCSILTSLNDTCVLIARFDALEFDTKRNTKAKKILASIEAGGGKAVCLDHRKPAQLAKMLTDGASKRGCRMDDSTAQYLIQSAGNDLSILKNELDKLCFFVKSGKITKETVDKVCIKSVEASVYDLTAKLFLCDGAAALKVLDSLFYMRVEPMVILYTISAAYIDMFRMLCAKKSNIPTSTVAAKYGYKGKEFVLDRAAGNLRKFDGKKLSLSFDAILNADKGLKSYSGNERTVLEELIVKLCYILSRGETV